MGKLTAAVLSLLVLGLGQVYCGKLLRGAAWFVIGGMLIVGAAAVTGPLAILVAILVYVGCMVDAYRIKAEQEERLKALR